MNCTSVGPFHGPTNLLHAGSLPYGSTGPARSLFQPCFSSSFPSLLWTSTCSGVRFCKSCRWSSAPPWVSMVFTIRESQQCCHHRSAWACGGSFLEHFCMLRELVDAIAKTVLISPDNKRGCWNLKESKCHPSLQEGPGKDRSINFTSTLGRQ